MNSIQSDRAQGRVVLTFGTFDLFHIGHLRILERASKFGEKLIVGVSSDSLNHSKKGIYPTYNENDRIEIVRSIRCVDNVFLEESLEKKREYLIRYGGDVLVMGDDWKGRFDEFSDIVEVVYLPRTALISTTAAKNKIIDEAKIIYDPIFPK
jgi:choline-phosphate cytidylyltransferase